GCRRQHRLRGCNLSQKTARIVILTGGHLVWGGLHLLTASAIQVSAVHAAQSKMWYAGRSPKRGMKLRNAVACPHFWHGGFGVPASSVGMASCLPCQCPSTLLSYIL